MATAPLSEEKAREAVATLQAAINKGYDWPGIVGVTSAMTIAAKALNVPKSTLASRVEFARERFGIEPAPYVPPPPETPAMPERMRVRVKAYSSPDENPPTRIVGIGDLHDAPNLPKDRFGWIARYVGENQPDRVISIGDIASFDSMSRHDAPGSLNQKLRPSFQNDMESLEEALNLYCRELGETSIRHDITLGNHEERIKIFETGTAELEGALWPQFEDLMARYDWRMTPYKKYLFVGGVGFTHVPMAHALDKPVSGMTLNPIANGLTFSLVFGHSHRASFLRQPKFGPQNSIEILNLGSAMPHGYFPSYNKSEQGAPSWGIYDFVVQGGHITSHRFVPMTELEQKFA